MGEQWEILGTSWRGVGLLCLIIKDGDGHSLTEYSGKRDNLQIILKLQRNMKYGVVGCVIRVLS